METKKSIQDIKLTNSNIIPDMVSEQPIKKRVKRASIKTETKPEIETEVIDTPREILYTESKPLSQEPINNKSHPSTLTYKRFMRLLSQIKPTYLIGLVVIILGLIILLLFPLLFSSKNSIDQSKAEVEMVKKQLSKHIILPQNEQIDIRKITNKIEDPFFKDASIGDYLIILYKNRIAYIFSIDKDIIVNAGVVFIDPKTATTTSTTTKIK